MDVLFCNIYSNCNQHWSWNRSHFACRAMPPGIVINSFQNELDRRISFICNVNTLCCFLFVGVVWDLYCHIFQR